MREAFDTVLDLVEAAIPIPGTYICQLTEWDLELLSQKDDSEEFAVIKTHALAVGPNTLIRSPTFRAPLLLLYLPSWYTKSVTSC